ncbi:MAG: PAS domain S-box protein [Proteobacteria bacterium]|nr:PAS domain S-box protein [Pseudomonadota bacterium]HQR03721.1 histidine kinase [Rhodocyclaceae bacterium]
MKDTTLCLLLVSAVENDLVRLRDHFAALGETPELLRVNSAAALRAALQPPARWDVLLYAPATPDLSLPMLRGQLAESATALPLLFLFRDGEEPGVDRTTKADAGDCFHLDHLESLLPAIDRVLRETGHDADHRLILEKLRGSESRFRALAGNLPGMVFQLAREADGMPGFLYVSEGGHKLLGLKPHELLSDFPRFIDAIEPLERQGLLVAIEESARSMTTLNWEGRTRPRGQYRQKWINLRSTPEPREDGSIHWHGIATDITRSKEAEAALRRSGEQLAELSSYLEDAKEDERERIARDIHDELGSLLVALKIEASLLSGKLKETPPLRKKAQGIESLIDQAMGTASRVARELRPGILKEFGLSAAIECQAEDFTQRTGITCRAQCDDEDLDLDEPVSLALFRIVQEALTNIAKHAHASLVAVRLCREGRHVILEVRDNGRGIAEDDMGKPKSFGLRGIRERARSLHGECCITAGEQGGTHVLLRLPLDAPVPVPEIERQGSLF